MLSVLISIFYLTIRYCSLFTYALLFFRATKNIVRFSHENVRMYQVVKEHRAIVNIVNS